MENCLNKIKAAIVGVCGTITAVFGWLGWLCIAFTACMLLDYITGTAAAAKSGKWSSAVARSGCWHKCGMIIATGCAAICDGLLGLIINNIPAVNLPFEYGALICPLVLCWYIATELGSVLENAVALGAPVPGFLSHILAAVKDKAEDAGTQLVPDHTPDPDPDAKD